MRKTSLAILALAFLAFMPQAWAIVGETTVKVVDAGTPVPQATISVTFKDQSGRKLQTVRRPTLRTGPGTGTRKVTIPDNTKTADIAVTTANGGTATRTGVDVAQLINTEIVIDVPGGSAPPQTAGPGSRTPGPAASVPPYSYPSGGGLPAAGSGTWTRIPQVSGGTRFGGVGIGEVAAAESKRTLPGASGSAGIVVPVDRVFFNFDYFTALASVNGFSDSVNSSVPVGTSSAFTYIVPNPASGSTGVGPTATGQSVTIGTSGQFWDVAVGAGGRVPVGQVFAPPTGAFWTYGLGVRYRHMTVEHNIAQQSSTFPDLNLAINLDLRSQFIGPSFSLGFEATQPLPSGFFGGASAFIAPGALITDASARQASRCGPCGAASPEFNLILQRDFSESGFAFMAGVSGFVGYQFNPRVRIQAEASYQYLSDMKSFAVPTSPVRQPIALTSGFTDTISVGGRLVFDIFR